MHPCPGHDLSVTCDNSTASTKQTCALSIRGKRMLAKLSCLSWDVVMKKFLESKNPLHERHTKRIFVQTSHSPISMLPSRVSLLVFGVLLCYLPSATEILMVCPGWHEAQSLPVFSRGARAVFLPWCITQLHWIMTLLFSVQHLIAEFNSIHIAELYSYWTELNQH